MFNVFSNCFSSSHIFTDEELKKFNSFMFCRWLSGNYETLKLAQCINLNYHMPDDMQLKMAQSLFKGKKVFIRFPKALKMDEEYEKKIKYISEYYNVSLDKSKLYLRFMSDDEFDYIKKQIDTKYQLVKPTKI